MIEFSLPEDREEYQIANKAGDLFAAFQEFNEFIRRIDKHEDFTEAETAIIDRIRSRWYDDTGDLEIW